MSGETGTCQAVPRLTGPGFPGQPGKPARPYDPTARWSSMSVRPEVHTPLSSRLIVRTVRRVAAGLVTYVGRVTGTGSHSVGSIATAGIDDVSTTEASSPVGAPS